MRIDIWHNMMWPRYKAQIFSELHALSHSAHDLTVFQIAETEVDRGGLSGIDRNDHRYTCVLLFKGAYSRISKARLYFEVARRTLESRADLFVLAGYERLEYWLQALLLTARRKPFIFFCESTIYDQPQTPFKTVLKRLFCRLSSGALCYGRRSADYLSHNGLAHDRIFPGCQAAATADGYDQDVVAAERLRLAPDETTPVFLYVGRLAPEKQISTLLEAFSRVLTTSPNARLMIVGTGPMEASLRDLAEALGLGDRISFAGGKSGQDLRDAYLRSTCLVLPSSSEPWGLVVNEVLSQGCPVLVSDRCGCGPELVIEGVTGLQFASGDIDDLAEKLSRMTHEYGATPAVIEACLRQIQPYTPRNAAMSILAGLERVLAARKPGEQALLRRNGEVA